MSLSSFQNPSARLRLAPLVVVRAVTVAAAFVASAASVAGGAHVLDLLDDLFAEILRGEAAVGGDALAGGDDDGGAPVGEREDVVERRLIDGEDEVCRGRV